jgi:hypothetical protein
MDSRGRSSILLNPSVLACQKRVGYTFCMPSAKERKQWFLFQYVGRNLTPLSRPFTTKEQAEKARQKYPERERGKIGIGVVRD